MGWRWSNQKWWQVTRSPRTAFLIGLLAIFSCALHLAGRHWLLGVFWGLLSLAYVGSGLAMLRWGAPVSPTKYPTRWRPFWPPDQD